MTNMPDNLPNETYPPVVPDPQPNDYPGVTTLLPPDVPTDLVKRVESPRYSILGYYQVDDLPRFRRWKGILQASGAPEKWLFYGCPQGMLAQVLQGGEPLRYGEFFPALLGDAVYLFHSAQDAARAAFRFGMESQGCLISCRVVVGNVSSARQSTPEAISPPPGCDTVHATKGMDLGDGPLPGDMYTVFDPSRILMRYITRIELNH